MNVRLVRIVSREEKHAPNGDQRRRITRVLCSYYGDDGHEYRRAFEAYGEPIIPETGTVKSTAAAQRQW
jgi:hypothetical protein